MSRQILQLHKMLCKEIQDLDAADFGHEAQNMNVCAEAACLYLQVYTKI